MPAIRRVFALAAIGILLTTTGFTASMLVRDDVTPQGMRTASRALKVTCPDAPGFTATRATVERSRNCADAQRIQRMLLDSGASAANVQVTQAVSGSLIGPERQTFATVQVFLPAKLREPWSAEDAANMIAKALSTLVGNVTIADKDLHMLFPDAPTPPIGTASLMARMPS